MPSPVGQQPSNAKLYQTRGYGYGMGWHGVALKAPPRAASLFSQHLDLYLAPINLQLPSEKLPFGCLSEDETQASQSPGKQQE